MQVVCMDNRLHNPIMLVTLQQWLFETRERRVRCNPEVRAGAYSRVLHPEVPRRNSEEVPRGFGSALQKENAPPGGFKCWRCPWHRGIPETSPKTYIKACYNLLYFPISFPQSGLVKKGLFSEDTIRDGWFSFVRVAFQWKAS